MGEDFGFFSPLGFEIQSNFDYKISKINLYMYFAVRGSGMLHVDINRLRQFAVRGHSSSDTVMVQQYCDVRYDPSYDQQ